MASKNLKLIFAQFFEIIGIVGKVCLLCCLLEKKLLAKFLRYHFVGKPHLSSKIMKAIEVYKEGLLDIQTRSTNSEVTLRAFGT